MALDIPAQMALLATLDLCRKMGGNFNRGKVRDMARGLHGVSYTDAEADDFLARHHVPDQDLCDFCNAIGCAAEYEASDEAMPMPPFMEAFAPESLSIGSWGACAACVPYVDAGDRQGLLDHSFEQERDPRFPEKAIRIALSAAHETFWRARTGKKVLL